MADIKRRDLILLLAGAAAPLRAYAQPTPRPQRIGYLGFGAASNWTSEIEALRSGLRSMGYVEGKNVVIEYKWAERAEQTYELATELVQMKVDVIFAPASTQVGPARRATSTIPIIFAQHADPVGLGDVSSLSHPGQNITGISMLLTELSVKELEILREILPGAGVIGILWNPTTPSHPTAVAGLQTASAKLGVQVILAPAGTAAEIQTAFESFTREGASGVLVLSSPLYTAESGLLAECQTKYRLPEIFANRGNVEAGGLISYGANLDDLYRRAAVFIAKILRGAKPADLPVEQAYKYSVVINIKAAKALGLAIPSTVLARADELIE
jgi:putative tryptophan/tyrosine transport system substrate-binding protein